MADAVGTFTEIPMPTRGYTEPGGRCSHYDPILSTAHTSNLWKTCPLLEYMFDPSIGNLHDERFNTYDATATTGDYLLTQATAGSAAISTAYIGTLAINSGSTTATQGANVQQLKSAWLPAANKSIWAEFRVLFTGVTNLNVEVFVGLAASDTSVIASSAMNVNNHLGWQSLTDDGVILFDSDKAGTGTTAASMTLAASTWYRLGFFYDGVADTVQQYVDGVAVGSAIATTYIPKAVMYPSFVCQSGGTDQPVLNVGGYRIFQLR